MIGDVTGLRLDGEVTVFESHGALGAGVLRSEDTLVVEADFKLDPQDALAGVVVRVLFGEEDL